MPGEREGLERILQGLCQKAEVWKIVGMMNVGVS